jgi:hypothetical protein
MGWLQTSVLLTSASQVVRIKDMSHQCISFFYGKEVSQSSNCFLPLVNSWAQVRNQCFSARAVFKPLLQT